MIVFFKYNLQKIFQKWFSIFNKIPQFVALRDWDTSEGAYNVQVKEKNIKGMSSSEVV